MDPYPLSVLAESHTLRGIGLSQCLETPGGTTPSQLGTLIVKKLFNALDSPPQGVCSARVVRCGQLATQMIWGNVAPKALTMRSSAVTQRQCSRRLNARYMAS